MWAEHGAGLTYPYEGCPGAARRCLTTIQLPKLHRRIAADLSCCAFGRGRRRRRHASNEIIRMTENGTATFVSPDAYSAAIGAAKVDLFVKAGGEFKGRLTWLNLGGLHVLR